MKFRDFILQEEFGLGDLGPKVDKIFSNPKFTQVASYYTSSDMSGSEQSDTLGSAGHPLHLPSTDLVLPSIEKTGRIKVLEYKKNPIYLELSDGTRAHFTYDQFKRIEGKPALGKVMRITFQRHPKDNSPIYSKIEKAIVLDG